MSASQISIGTTIETLTLLSELTVPVMPPKTEFVPGVRLRECADLSTRWVGLPTGIWRWTFLPRSMRDQLRAICSGSSVSGIVIRMPVNDESDEYKTFEECVMYWPQREEKDFSRRIDFVITFANLVEVVE